MMTAENIGIRIRQLRLERGWKQFDFEEVGLSIKRISDIETGRLGIGIYTLNKIIQHLGITEMEFFNSEIFTNERCRQEVLKTWQLKQPKQYKYRLRTPGWMVGVASGIMNTEL